ncbi:MAG: ATP-binding cassette domain-containing protein [Bdellovibrionales bacterium]|nr:ATP-binding cassette domain-containing protein [Bdellovibrionales bacterium]
MKEKLLAVSQLKISKGLFPLLRNVTFDLYDSEIMCVIGPNNAGQDLLLRALLGDLQRHKIEGEVVLAGSAKLGYVSDSLNCIDELTVFQNLSLVLNFVGIQSQTHLAEAVEASLRAVEMWSEMKPRLHHLTSTLSDFEKRRLNLARTLIFRPRILLLENPTKSLDPVETSAFEKMIDGLKKQLAVIWVTHDLEQAGRVADTLLFLKSGGMVEYGSTEVLFTTPVSSETENFLSRRFYV